MVDHDTGHLVWVGPGRTDADFQVFYDELGNERAAELTHISADMAGWIARVVAKRAPNAVCCADAFHVVAWAIEALDVERRRAWNQAAGRNAITTVMSQRGRARAPRSASHAPATRSGRTPKISPTTNAPSSTGSPRPTPGSIAPTSSKKDCDSCLPSRATPASTRSTGGCRGRADHACRPSSNSPARS